MIMAMTILQALKRIKHLDRKIKTGKERLAKWASYISPEEEPPQYEAGPLMQAITDWITEKAKIKHKLHVVNATRGIKYEGKVKTIDELIIEATVSLPEVLHMLKLLRRKEKSYQTPATSVVKLQYNQKDRDKMIDSTEYEIEKIMAGTGSAGLL
jgi:hypothetical protein